MLLEITSTTPPATDLGFLLAKNPSRVQAYPLAFGQAHVFYPEAEEARCTAALLVEVDPVALLRRCGDDRAWAQRVMDRPYTASSFTSVAMSEIFCSALDGRSRERPLLAATPLPFRVRVSVVPCRGREGEGLLRRLFEPLGYAVDVQVCPLAPPFPSGSQGRHAVMVLEGTVRLRELLAHLCVLLASLDEERHQWIGDEGVERLLLRGEGWLSGHPEESWIVGRHLEREKNPMRSVLARLVEETDIDAGPPRLGPEERLEARTGLGDMRIAAVLQALGDLGARRIVQLGCGDGRLLEVLLTSPSFEWVCGVDVSHRALESAARRLERVPEHRRAAGDLLHGSPLYRDRRLEGYDAAVLLEVVEHVDVPRLAALERNVFESLQAKVVIVTTPNCEYNPCYPDLAPDAFRHSDHRFEWSRSEFTAWARRVAERFGYQERLVAVGPEHPQRGAPTQMAVFQARSELR